MKQKKIPGPKVEISAPGKIILSGEHSVVYGHPALVTACNFRAKVGIEKSKGNFEIYPARAKNIILKTLKNSQKLSAINNMRIFLESEIPVGSGMGSSAAVAVSVAAAFLKIKTGKLVLKKINEIAYEAEKFYHRNPSGVDIAISTYGGLLWYRKEAEKLKISAKIRPLKNIHNTTLINTGKPVESTKEMVEIVAKKYARNPKRMDKILRNIENTTRGFLRFFLNEENIKLENLIHENERYLEELGVVSPTTMKLIRKIEKIGGAAKISGAGGLKDNSGILMVYHPKKNKFLKFAKEKKLDILPARFFEKGVRIERN